MNQNCTPLASFHPAIRAILNDEDHETNTAFKLTERIKVVLQTGKVPGYRLSADQSAVEPALTPETDEKSFTLLVNKTALMFPALTKEQRDDLQNENYQLENYG